ncbi:MAG: hypothetical protein FJX72_03290, partial [Armatimonadetes bacterium]|nr:hypothetical protein [Armatimonadota bacterium]
MSDRLGPMCRRAAMMGTITLAVAGMAVAQAPSGGKKTLSISVPKEGEHFIRFLPSADAKQAAQLPIRFLDRRTTVGYDLSEIGKTASIAVDNVKTGDTAIRPLYGSGAPLGGLLDLRAADFDHVRQLDVHVAHNGKPVAAAKVTVTARNSPAKTVVIDPARQGVATFEDVRMGRAKLAVEYGDKLTQTQDLDIAGDRPPGVLVVNVAVASSVPVVEGAPPSGSSATAESPQASSGRAGEPQPATPAPQTGGFTAWLGNLLGLAVAAGAIYGLYRWAKSGGMAATLNKAGIEVSGPTADQTTPTPWSPAQPQPPVVADPTLCEFCGEKKDGAGRCACSALPTGAAAPPVSPAG